MKIIIVGLMLVVGVNASVIGKVVKAPYHLFHHKKKSAKKVKLPGAK
jgi:hypothetical protein